MAINKKDKKKYKAGIDLMKAIGMEDWEVEDKIYQTKELENWKPVTLGELMSMSQEELSQLKSFCWKEGHSRCVCIGINDLVVTEKEGYYNVEFGDDNGGPSFECDDLNTEIHKLGDGQWDYGLYKKKNEPKTKS